MTKHESDRYEMKAWQLANLMHGGQKYTGLPYMDAHLRPIANKVKHMMRGHPDQDLYVAAAYLHDIVEDTPVEHRMVRAMFPSDIASAVYYLTCPETQSYAGYIEFLAVSPGRAGRIARAVKLADLQWNLANCLNDPGYYDLFTRYSEALTYLYPYLREDGRVNIERLNRADEFVQVFNDLRNG